MAYYLDMLDGVLSLSSEGLLDGGSGRTLSRKTFVVDVEKDSFPVLAVCMCVCM